MTKEKTLKLIDEVIEIHKKLLDKIGNITKKCTDSPRIVNEMGWAYNDAAQKISSLENLRKDIEKYDDEKGKVDSLFFGAMPEPYRPMEVNEFSFTKKDDEEE